MQYVSLVLLTVGLVLLGLDLGGVTPGAGGFANIALLGSLIFVIAHGISESIHNRRLSHYHR
jgi:hypothetical protein